MGLGDQILAAAASKFRVEKVNVPEWGMDVWVRELQVGEKDRFEGEQISAKGLSKYSNFRSRFLVLVLCDETGARAFRDDQVGALSALPASGVERVFSAACRLNKFTDEDVQSLEKNSEKTPSDV
jgi:hypothetical protein